MRLKLTFDCVLSSESMQQVGCELAEGFRQLVLLEILFVIPIKQKRQRGYVESEQNIQNTWIVRDGRLYPYD